MILLGATLVTALVSLGLHVIERALVGATTLEIVDDKGRSAHVEPIQ